MSSADQIDIIVSFLMESGVKMILGDLRQALDSSMETLPDRSRDVFRLSYLDGLTHAEIAAKLGISERTVDWHIYTALQSLRSSLSGI